MQSGKLSLMVVERRALHRERIKMRLDALYEVTDFAALPDALRHAGNFPPSAIVICEETTGGDFFFLQSMRLESAFNHMPIIIILAEENLAQSVRALAAGADACLAKPYLPSALIEMISAAISRACERKWDLLPEPQAAALKNSRAIFNAMIDADQTVPYADIGTACLPLMAATEPSDVSAILGAVREHDDFTYAHSLRVGMLMSVFGRNIGMAAPERAVLAAGGLLLDIGKSTIPVLLLNKSGLLTPAETAIMHGHVGASLNILSKSPGVPEGVFVIAANHHENMDGSGYPNGLPGSALNELARMATIADVFAALTDRRVYRDSITPENAFGMMNEYMQSKLDMRLVHAFREILYDNNIAQALTATTPAELAIQNV